QIDFAVVVLIVPRKYSAETYHRPFIQVSTEERIQTKQSSLSSISIYLVTKVSQPTQSRVYTIIIFLFAADAAASSELPLCLPSLATAMLREEGCSDLLLYSLKLASPSTTGVAATRLNFVRVRVLVAGVPPQNSLLTLLHFQN
uniref:Uncharacterized protein n=1 Tax=Oryza brachyantha TaxID=4533 RepID=J3MHY8_ORYBR